MVPGPTRRSYFALAIAFIGFAIYGSLIPFNARALSLADARELFHLALTTWPEHISRSDFLANILLFVPIGFSLSGALLVERVPDRRMAAIAPVALLGVSIMVSLVAEFAQTFTVDRSPTAVDVLAQALGCSIGIVLWALTGTAFHSWIRQTLASAPDDRLLRVLAAYGLAWIFVHLAPFDVTLDLGELAQRFRGGDIALTPRDGSSSRVLWDALAEVLGAVPLGAAAVVAWPAGRSRTRLDGVAIGGAIVISMEAAQVFVRSHAALVTDALLGTSGVLLGVWTASVLPPTREPTRPSDRGVFRAPAGGVLLLWCVVLAMYHWQPYDFSIDAGQVKAKLSQISLVPFASYARGRPLNALNDVLTKVSIAAPLGFIAAFVFRHRTGPSRATVVAWTCVFAAILGVVECGQFFVQTRSPDPTDVLVGTVAAAGGLLTGFWVSPPRAQRS